MYIYIYVLVLAASCLWQPNNLSSLQQPSLSECLCLFRVYWAVGLLLRFSSDPKLCNALNSAIAELRMQKVSAQKTHLDSIRM